MSLKRSVRKSTRTAVMCGAIVGIEPILVGASLERPAGATSDKK